MRTLRVFNCTTSFSDQRALSKSMFSGTRPLCEPSVYLIVLLLFPTSVRSPSLCFLALSPYRSCTPFEIFSSLRSKLSQKVLRCGPIRMGSRATAHTMRTLQWITLFEQKHYSNLFDE